MGQTFAGIDSAFYGLPLNDARSKIKSQIVSDSRFIEKVDKDTSYHYTPANIYFGKIVRHSFPANYQIDSANIELSSGYGMFTKPKSKGHQITYLNLIYYFSDIAASNAFARELWTRVRIISKDTFYTTVGRKEDNNFEYGMGIKMHRRKYFPQLRVLQREYTNKVFIVRIEYERLGD